MIKYSLQNFTNDNVIKKTKLIGLDNATKTVSDQVDTNTTAINNNFTALAKRLLTGASANPVCTNALLVNTASPTDDMNLPQIVRNTTSNIPTDLSVGVREVIYYFTNYITVRITGYKFNGSQCIWLNTFTGTNWRGWNCISVARESRDLSGNGKLFAVRVGNLVTLHFIGITVAAQDNSFGVGDELKPMYEVVFPVFIVANTNTFVCRIATDGSGRVYTPGYFDFKGGAIFGTITYAIN